SQTCPNCGAHTGKKTLDIRIHSCSECGYTTTRDVAAAQEVKNRGVKVSHCGLGGFRRGASGEPVRAVGQIVLKNVCEDGLTGTSGHTSLVKNLGNRNPKSRVLGIPH
ncbi:MAG: zinc ribbon domain-containing protein, partial [Waterburya sp.]